MMNSFYKLFVTLYLFSTVSMAYSQPKDFLDDCPQSLEITNLESCGDYQFTLGEGQPGEDVYWYFDDGTYEDHTTHTITHHYNNHGSYAGYAQYTSDWCPTTTYNFFLIVPECNSTSIVSPETNQVHIFPNPITDHLYITGIESGEKIHLEIFDFSGRIIWSTTYREVTPVAIPGELEGMYILVVSLNSKSIRQPVFIH